jgi:hypothetical protein
MRPPGRQPVPSAAAWLRSGQRASVLGGTAGLERGVCAKSGDLRVDHARGVGVQKPMISRPPLFSQFLMMQPRAEMHHLVHSP